MEKKHKMPGGRMMSDKKMDKTTKKKQVAVKGKKKVRTSDGMMYA